MKPHLHSIISAKKFKGKPEDYDFIHEMMDFSKIAVPDVRHRAIFHSSFGCFVMEHIFGKTFINSAGLVVSVRDIAEQHTEDDLGFIPTMEHWFKNMPIEEWMGGPRKTVTKMSLVD